MAPKQQSARPHNNEEQPNTKKEPKILCIACTDDSWICAYEWTLGRTFRICCDTCPKTAVRQLSSGKEQESQQPLG